MQSENPWYIATAELAEMLFPEAGVQIILAMVRRGEKGGL